MRKRQLSGLLVAVAVALAGGVARGDEVDDLIRKIKPPERFKGYVGDFSVAKKQHRLRYASGWRTIEMFVVKDGGKHVALIPKPGGTIRVLDFNPKTAPKTLELSDERWVNENSIGTLLRTDAFIPAKAGASDKTYEFTKGKGTLTLTRRYKGTDVYNTWTHKSDGAITVETVNTFVFKCDPVLGYVVEGTFGNKVSKPPKEFEYFSAKTSGICDVWAGAGAPQRVVITPGHKPGFEGYYLNFPAVDWCDNDKKIFRCRDKGFAAFLTGRAGWSPTTTICGASARLVVCNAHSDLDFKSAHRDGLRTRILALPPEITRHVWDTMSVRFKGRSRVQVRIGQVEMFEDQPLPLTTPVLALTSTGGGPRISTDVARSGKKSMIVKGRVWFNLPQVLLKARTRYRLQAWAKMEPWTDQQRKQEAEKIRARIEKERKKGKQVADFKGFAPAGAFITGHLYVSTPHNKKREVLQQTNAARPDAEGWQEIKLEFTTPKWAPFIDVVFHAEACTAYIDDFSLMPVRKAGK